MHIAKLQHRNLAKLLGCCIQVKERMLVYEFMPDKSLDHFIFAFEAHKNISTTYLSSKADGDKGILLDWPKRFLIINGIALGLLYLHQDSRHRVIHRDLKAGNILLDIEINPKISYFGLARSILGNKNEATTNHVVGTYGYMAPEYIIDGLFSTKSDIYSFGVLVLEIASTFFIEDKSLDIVDASIRDSINLPEVMRSIHVGLLCVQQSLEDRPNMSYVLKVLSSEWELPQPKKLGFFTQRDLVGGSSSSSSSNNKVLSINKLSVSEVDPR
nr:G-type lectin S-receptor-like serine/threonine-protein kinase At4g27290 [Arachis hypogaea]